MAWDRAEKANFEVAADNSICYASLMLPACARVHSLITLVFQFREVYREFNFHWNCDSFATESSL